MVRGKKGGTTDSPHAKGSLPMAEKRIKFEILNTNYEIGICF